MGSCESVRSMLLKGDVLEQMARLPDHSVDMVLCDPPQGTFQKRWDWSTWWREVQRVTKSDAAIVLFASGMHTADLMKSNVKQWRYNLVWMIMDAPIVREQNTRRMPTRIHEDICVFYASPPTYHPQKSKGHAPQKSHHAGSSSNGYGKVSNKANCATFGSEERYPHSVLQYPAIATAKPKELFQHLIKTYTNPHAVVLDSFAQRPGSISAACQETSRTCIQIRC